MKKRRKTAIELWRVIHNETIRIENNYKKLELMKYNQYPRYCPSFSRQRLEELKETTRERAGDHSRAAVEQTCCRAGARRTVGSSTLASLQRTTACRAKSRAHLLGQIPSTEMRPIKKIYSSIANCRRCKKVSATPRRRGKLN